VRDTGGRALRERLIESLRPRELLLVLDNVEQVAAAAPLATELLGACPQLTILATSRGALRLRGEHELPVAPLALPDRVEPTAAPEALRQYAAVELFLHRAWEVRPDFRLTAANAPAVAGICRRLDGLPLAIELAAARIRVLTPVALLAQLDRRLALLTGGAQDLPARQRTLRDAIAWSHDLLDPATQALFRRLSVFAGGCTLADVGTVCEGGGDGARAGRSDATAFLSSILDELTALVHQQLLRVDEGPDGEPRFAMLETIREYATEQLVTSGETEALRRRHAEYFLALAEQAGPQLQGPEQAIWLDRIARELDNLRAALGWAAESGAAEMGLRLVGALARFWWLQGHFSEGRVHLERLLALPEAAAPTAARATALQALGMLLSRHADFDDDARGQAATLACYEEGLAIARTLGDRRQVAATLRELGRLGIELGDWATARPRLEESLAIARTLDDDQEIALALSELGSLTLFEEDYERANLLLTESLALFRKRGDIGNISFALFFLGHLAREQGNFSDAHDRFAESLTILPLSQYRWALHGVLEGIACVAAAQGHAARALRLSGAATARRAAIDAAVGRAWGAKYRQWLAPAWQALGEVAGSAAWAEGRAMTQEESLAYALEDRYPSSSVASTAWRQAQMK
jgi:predicted ATPase